MGQKKKLILSRKGFDSSSGGGPSPIIDGKLISLPIPQAGTGITYDQLNLGNINYGQLCSDLFRMKTSECHLDPDICQELLADRHPGWRPAFGQMGAALSHLNNQQVGVGDMFLFFGWFRQAEQKNGKWRFVPNAPDLHVIFSHLQVREVWKGEMGEEPPYLQDHPHIVHREMFHSRGNAIFISEQELSGTFDYRPSRVLTAIEGKRSKWKLPSIFFDKRGYSKLSYHHRQKGEKLLNEEAYLINSVPRGQEFVVEMDDQIKNWIKKLLK